MRDGINKVFAARQKAKQYWDAEHKAYREGGPQETQG
jgi:hypothetical protein